MKATINGEVRDLPEGTTIATLLEALGVTHNGIAVAKNDRVIRRSAYEDSPIADGDAIEIIKAVAGG
ncbi:MAG TPA: sulfur carrier protein ThiS [Candidatus Acidoferrales bacterium]|nr:sulfur carrier protein ThiS [Candidatus Acidoferrales bacterium]